MINEFQLRRTQFFAYRAKDSFCVRVRVLILKSINYRRTTPRT